MNVSIEILPIRVFKLLLMLIAFLPGLNVAMEADPHGTNKRLKSLKNNFHLQLKGDQVIDALHEDWQAGGNLIEHIDHQLDEHQEGVGHTLFGCAVRTYDDSQFIRYLLENGASAGAICLDGEKGSHPVIRDVAEYGNPATLKLFIANGALGTGATYENCALSDWNRRNVLCAMINALRLCLHNPLCSDKKTTCANYQACIDQLLTVFKKQNLCLADANDKDNKPYSCVVDSGYEPLIKLFVDQYADFKPFVESYGRSIWQIAFNAINPWKSGSSTALDLYGQHAREQEAERKRQKEMAAAQAFIAAKKKVVDDRIIEYVNKNTEKADIAYLISLKREQVDS